MKEDKGNYILRVYITAELRDKLESYARKYGVTSLSSIVKYILFDYFSDKD